MSTQEILAELPSLSPAELAEVQAKLDELVGEATTKGRRLFETHPALGIWHDRDDLPTDSVEASKVLRQRMMRRDDA